MLLTSVWEYLWATVASILLIELQLKRLLQFHASSRSLDFNATSSWSQSIKDTETSSLHLFLADLGTKTNAVKKFGSNEV